MFGNGTSLRQSKVTHSNTVSHQDDIAAVYGGHRRGWLRSDWADFCKINTVASGFDVAADDGNTVVEYWVIRRIPTGMTCIGSNPFMLSGRLLLQNTPDDLEREQWSKTMPYPRWRPRSGRLLGITEHPRQAKAGRSRKVQIFIGDNTRVKCGLIPDALSPDSLRRYKSVFQHSVGLRPPKIFLICVAIQLLCLRGAQISICFC